MEQFFLSLLLLFVSLLSLTLFILFFRHIMAPNLPPGRMGLPVIGESLAFLSSMRKGHIEKFINERMTKYSSQVFKTSIFGEPTVVLCGSTCNKFLFSNENKLVRSWWPENFNKILPTSSSEESKRMRSTLPRFLGPKALQRYVGVMDAIAQRHFASYWENKREVTVFPLAKREIVRTHASLKQPQDLYQYPLTCPEHRGIKASKLFREELLKIIKQRKVDLADGKASPTQDILSHMLLSHDENGQYMAEHDIAVQIMGLLIGGHESPSAVCTLIVKYLAELPQNIYQHFYQEQMEIAKSKSPGEFLNWNDIEKMKYSWIACEVMRLATPIDGTFREAINGFVFNGFSIPKGWKLYWSASSTHKNPECFLELEKFDPSRFEGNGPAPYTFVPFGGGPRMCLGKEYAGMKILVFMHNLVKRFKWENIIPDKKIVVKPPPIPTKGLPIRLYPHQA